MSKKDKCEGKDFILAGNALEDGSIECFRHNKDHSVTVGSMKPLEEGKPLPQNGTIVKRIGEGPYYEVVAETNEINHKNNSENNSSRSKVSNKAYREGWDKVFKLKHNKSNHNIN